MKRPLARLSVTLMAVLATVSLCASSPQPNCDDLIIYRPAFVRLAEVALNLEELTIAEVREIIASETKVNPMEGHERTIENFALRKKFESLLKDLDQNGWQEVRTHLSAMLDRRATIVEARKASQKLTENIILLKKIENFDHSPKKAIWTSSENLTSSFNFKLFDNLEATVNRGYLTLYKISRPEDFRE